MDICETEYSKLKVKQEKDIEYEDRICDCCGGDILLKLWEYYYSSNTIHNIFNWHVKNVVCQNCGFVFVSPVPSEKSLIEYYSDSYAHVSGSKPDYSVENRMFIINKYRNKNGAKSYIEIGSNNCPQLISELTKVFESVDTVEVNQNCRSTYASVDSLYDIKNKEQNLIALYFVLEHVANPYNFLKSCKNSLSSDGYLILEVPDLYLYPLDMSGLYLYEHLNHFSPQTLTSLANKIGLELVEISHSFCSRPFGFTAVYKLADEPKSNASNRDEVEVMLAKSCVAGGLRKIDNFEKALLKIRTKIDGLDSNESAIIWVANNICKSLFKAWNTASNIYIVDIDPDKCDYMLPLKVYHPSAVIEEIAKAKLLVINSDTHAEHIQKWIYENTKKVFDDVTVIKLGNV